MLPDAIHLSGFDVSKLTAPFVCSSILLLQDKCLLFHLIAAGGKLSFLSEGQKKDGKWA